MGAAASTGVLPEVVDKASAKKLAGEDFDEDVFDEMAIDGWITRARLEVAVKGEDMFAMGISSKGVEMFLEENEVRINECVLDILRKFDQCIACMQALIVSKVEARCAAEEKPLGREATIDDAEGYDLSAAMADVYAANGDKPLNEQWLGNREDRAKRKAIGKATYACCYHHGCKVKGVLLSEMLAFEEERSSTKQVFWWIDVFAVQHNTAGGWSVRQIGTAVEKIRATVMIEEKWDKPACLCNPWCVLMLMKTRTAKGELVVRMPPKSEAKLLSAVQNRHCQLGFKDIMQSWGGFTFEKTKFKKVIDRQVICDSVADEMGGSAAANKPAVSLVLKWLADYAYKIVRAMDEKDVELRPLMMNQVARLYHTEGILKTAEPIYRECLTICKEHIGPSHRITLTVLNNLAMLLQDRGYYAEAAPMYKEVLNEREKVLGETHPHTLNSYYCLGYLHIAQAQHMEAKMYWEKYYQLHEIAFGWDDKRTLNAKKELNTLLKAMNEDQLLD
jgi:tetratricopeptide (TPR) repeat protein